MNIEHDDFWMWIVDIYFKKESKRATKTANHSHFSFSVKVYPFLIEIQTSIFIALFRVHAKTFSMELVLAACNYVFFSSKKPLENWIFLDGKNKELSFCSGNWNGRSKHIKTNEIDMNVSFVVQTYTHKIYSSSIIERTLISHVQWWNQFHWLIFKAI